MAMFTIFAHGRTFPQRYFDVDNRNLGLDASTKMEVWQIRKRYLSIGDLGYVKIDNPQGRRVIVIVVIITVVLADTPTVDDGKIGWLVIDVGVQPEILLPVRVRCLAG